MSANTEYWIENEKATLVSSELWSWWLYESINEVVNENLQTRKAIISCGCFVKYLTNQALKLHCSNLKSYWFDIQKGVLNLSFRLFLSRKIEDETEKESNMWTDLVDR